jgi:hypothetical protein
MMKKLSKQKYNKQIEHLPWKNAIYKCSLGVLFVSVWFWVLVGLRFEFRACKAALYHLSHTSSPFCSGCFGDGVSRKICLGWLQTLIFSMSASQVARIPGVSH